MVLPLASKLLTFYAAFSQSCFWLSAIGLHITIAAPPVLSGPSNANASANSSAIDFVRDVRPLLENYCYECHTGDEAQSGFRLDIKHLAMKGGDNHGPDILPGDPESSPLFQMLISEDNSERMPPDARMPDESIQLLKDWISQGASWPDGIDTAAETDKTDHWAFKPLRFPANNPPHRINNDSDHEVTGLTGSPQSIDTFIHERLVESGLAPNPPASKAQLLRRLSFNLTGLPPSLELQEKYGSDGDSPFESQSDYDQLVDELLSSHHFGQRWAQHWLDVVRYADTHGFEVNTERPNAWPYRDYVIESFNQDLPFDQFIREQIAGDQFGKDAATGFLVTASVLLPGQIGADDASKRLARQDSLDEIVNNISQSFLGLSVGCARCHDHKFDPVTAQDYYAMQAFVAGVEYEERPINAEPEELRKEKLDTIATQLSKLERELHYAYPLAMRNSMRPGVRSDRNIDRISPTKAKSIRLTLKKTNQYEPCIDELEVYDSSGLNVALNSAGTIPTASGEIRAADRHDLSFINNGVYGNSSSWMASSKENAWVQLEFPTEVVIERFEWGRDRLGEFYDRTPIEYTIETRQADGEWNVVSDQSDRGPFEQNAKWSLENEFASLSQNSKQTIAPKLELLRKLTSDRSLLQNRPMVFAGVFRQPDSITLLNRGDPEQPGAAVPPAFLAFLSSQTLPPEIDEASRRLQLANWIADPLNPLTARVIVNRVWQWNFGTGIVASPSDFGNNGFDPSHPELLDWLTAEFIRSGWSMKHLIRLIVTSETYKQSTQFRPDASQIDADNRLLWRFPMRRLDAETIRDTMLFVSGELNLQSGGPGFNLFNLRGGLTGFEPIEKFDASGLRRMVYAHKVRREIDAVFGAFDCPDGGQSTAVRTNSTTPIQALNLLNSRFTMERASSLSRVVREKHPDDLVLQIGEVYWRTIGRKPSDEELNDAMQAVSEAGLEVLARAILNSNELLFVE